MTPLAPEQAADRYFLEVRSKRLAWMSDVSDCG